VASAGIDAADGRVVILDHLRQYREEIIRVASSHGASNVRVFGSVARGTAHPASDIDVLIELAADVDGFAHFGALEDLRRSLEALLGRKVDVVELREPFSPRGRHIAEQIKREVIAL
jgi:predicted nucleotidyltransferase